MMKFLPYRLKYDFYGLSWIVILLGVTEVVAARFLLSASDVYSFQLILFFLFEFLYPGIFALLVISALGRDLTKENESFVFSLPISTFKLIIVRYIRLLFVFLLMNAPIAILFGIQFFRMKFNAEIDQNIILLLTDTLPNILLLGGVSLLLLMITRNPFMILVIVFGVLIFDFCTYGKVLENFSFMINYHRPIDNEQIIAINRLGYSFMGVACVVFGWMYIPKVVKC